MVARIDDMIDALAARQYGVVTRVQLIQQGITADAVDGRVKARRLRPLHRGVYVVGPLIVPRAREMAAILACGARSCLSHLSAGALWQLIAGQGEAALIDVSVANGDRGQRPGIRVHRVSSWKENHVTCLEGIPITSVCRTLFDLATVLDRRDLERALLQAERLQLLDRNELLSMTKTRVRRAGTPMLRTLLQSDAGPEWTQSEAEERFLALIRRSQLPTPETNVSIAEYRVDFLWRRERLVVEVDGFRHHSSQQMFESDRRRDARITSMGLRVVRVTWRQIVKEPEATAARVALCLRE